MLVAGFTASEYGYRPVAMVVVEFVAPLMTVTLLLVLCTKYTMFVSGFTATGVGRVPAATCVAVLV